MLVTRDHAGHSPLWHRLTAVTAAVMFGLAAGKARTGRQLGNPVLLTEGRVTVIDGLLAVAVLVGLVLNASYGWWWADPLAGYVLVFYAAKEARHIFREGNASRCRRGSAFSSVSRSPSPSPGSSAVAIALFHP